MCGAEGRGERHSSRVRVPPPAHTCTSELLFAALPCSAPIACASVCGCVSAGVSLHKTSYAHMCRIRRSSRMRGGVAHVCEEASCVRQPWHLCEETARVTCVRRPHVSLVRGSLTCQAQGLRVLGFRVGVGDDLRCHRRLCVCPGLLCPRLLCPRLLCYFLPPLPRLLCLALPYRSPCAAGGGRETKEHGA